MRFLSIACVVTTSYFTNVVNSLNLANGAKKELET
jgi:hypothetical protein